MIFFFWNIPDSLSLSPPSLLGHFSALLFLFLFLADLPLAGFEGVGLSGISVNFNICLEILYITVNI